MASKKQKNLDVGASLAKLKWDSENAITSLDQLYDFAYQEGVSTEQWYWEKTDQKKRWAMTLRIITILSVTAAGIIPILSPIFEINNHPLINPIWSSVAIAIGTASLGLDKFFGFSSGWIRYVTSALNVKSWLIEFAYDWESNRAMLVSTNKTDEKIETNAQLQLMITKCCAFAIKVSNAVQEETRQWAQEFQSSLSSLDQTLKQQASGNQASAILINLENGDKVIDGWEVEINGRKSGKHYGKTGVLTDIYPGLYKVAICGIIGKKQLHTEAAGKVAAGEVTTLSLILV